MLRYYIIQHHRNVNVNNCDPNLSFPEMLFFNFNYIYLIEL